MKIDRRQFLKGVSLVGAGAAMYGLPWGNALAASDKSITNPGTKQAVSKLAAPVTAEAADFVVRTQWKDLPQDVVELGKKSILDGAGLALAGERSESGPVVLKYLMELGVTNGPATVLGTNMRTIPMFAAFANGVAIHADDYDDAQLAVAPDRVYGLLTHPTVTTMPPALAIAEAQGRSGRDFMLGLPSRSRSRDQAC
jgi:2-methylcitrate dehydratase PrpD